jgi:hypothetical protein
VGTLSWIYDKVRRFVYPPVLAVGLLFCVLWSIAPLRALLTQWKWIDDATVFGVLGVVVTITVFELQQNEKTSKRLGDTLGSFSPAQSSKIAFGGVGEVYNALSPAIRKLVAESRAGTTTIDVLGLTLFSAWPVALEPQLQNEEIRNCVINLYLIDTAFAQKTPELFRPEWLRDMESKPKEIAAFLEENADRLKRNRVEVRLKPYAFFPGVHGFRTSDGHLMISFVHWAKQTLDNPNQFYEIFLPTDTSARAKAYRDLFDNWVQRAAR